MIIDVFHNMIPIAHAAEAVTEASGPVALFGLNIKLFIAQLINFGIVLFVLWKWVFTPLSKKLSERTDKIEKSLKDAQDIEAKLKQIEENRQNEFRKAQQGAADIVMKAEAAAEKTKQSIIAEAKQSAEKLLEQAKREIDQQKAQLIAEVREEAANLVVLATERIIKEKLNPAKDKELIKGSLKNL